MCQTLLVKFEKAVCPDIHPKSSPSNKAQPSKIGMTEGG